MNLIEYKEQGFMLYQLFSETIKNILMKNINECGIIFQIQNRAKDIKSLENKLIDHCLEPIENLDDKIFDLSGCRIIFYHNQDVKKFITSGILEEFFDIEDIRTKIFQPTKISSPSDGEYRGIHLTVKLKQNKLNLHEYKKFSNLFCEIQIQTILNHAWSETEHDIIYKKTKFDGIGNRRMEEIKNRLDDVMIKHIMPAGYIVSAIEIASF
ncbi:MAG: RelA/SpoT domain-containing protein [Legionellales bacterium]|nr:RelA/SpoT domain-containing protein [Legionellales bacterium]